MDSETAAWHRRMNISMTNTKCPSCGSECNERDEMVKAEREIERLRTALQIAEAGLADIGDADREPGDDLAWCENRAAQALPTVRAALGPNVANNRIAPQLD